MTLYIFNSLIFGMVDLAVVVFVSLYFVVAGWGIVLVSEPRFSGRCGLLDPVVDGCKSCSSRARYI